jgi:hypothetical protein
MKHFKRLRVYKTGPNLVIKDDFSIGHSYEWYEILKTINGQVVLNDYNYSSTTIKHKYKVRSLLIEKSVEFITIKAPNGLQNLDSAIRHYTQEIGILTKQINKPRSRLSTNLERQKMISYYQDKIKLIQSLS